MKPMYLEVFIYLRYIINNVHLFIRVKNNIMLYYIFIRRYITDNKDKVCFYDNYNR